MAKVSLDKLSAIAAVLAAIFAGYSGYVAHETMLTAHQDAVEQVQLSRQSQRPYVGVQVAQEIEGDKNPWWTLEFKATGATPALNVSVQMHLASIDDDADVEPAIREAEEQLRAHPETQDFYLIKNALLLSGNSQMVPLETVKSVNFKPHKVNIQFGTITYSDAFNQRHTTHYCIRLGSFCNAGNDAD